MVRDGTWTFDGEIVRIVLVVTGGGPATTSFGVDANNPFREAGPTSSNAWNDEIPQDRRAAEHKCEILLSTFPGWTTHERGPVRNYRRRPRPANSQIGNVTLNADWLGLARRPSRELVTCGAVGIASNVAG